MLNYYKPKLFMTIVVGLIILTIFNLIIPNLLMYSVMFYIVTILLHYYKINKRSALIRRLIDHLKTSTKKEVLLSEEITLLFYLGYIDNVDISILYTTLLDVNLNYLSVYKKDKQVVINLLNMLF